MGTLRGAASALRRGVEIGLVPRAEEAMGKLLRRDPGVDPDSYYFRTAVTFETGAPDYLWLNKLLAIGVGEPTPVEQGGGIAYNIHAVL